MFLCLLPAGAVKSQICEVEFGYISPHLSACNSTSVEATVEPLYKGHHRGMKFWPL